MIKTSTIQKGIIELSKSSVVICSIVRDCSKMLLSNIPVIDKLCLYTKEYTVIVFENDSKDATKVILENWAKSNPKVIISINDFNTGKTIPARSVASTVNPFYSRKRIEKMTFYRNQYLNLIDEKGISADFLLVVDLDVEKIDLDGIFDSFGQDAEWDSISANGYSFSPWLVKRYHDTYALIECGMQEFPQTEKSISENQFRFSFLKKGLPLFRVYSAYGGLAIYKFKVIEGLKYDVMPNNDQKVEVRCEHFSIHKQINDRGFNKFYINPNMNIKYQGITFNLIFKTLIRNIKRLTYKEKASYFHKVI